MAVVGRKVPSNEEVVAFVQLRPEIAASPDDIGAFGSPTFCVNNEIHFGKDRLREVEKEILRA